MGDVSSDIIKKLWYATPEDSWTSLLTGLNELEAYGTIDLHQYQDLEYAIKKHIGFESDFPDSPGELHHALDPFM